MAGPGQLDAYSAKRGMTRFLEAQASGQKVYYEPLYSTFNLVSLAAPATGLVTQQEITFFSTPIGQTGMGFGAQRPLTLAETNLEGGQNQFAAGNEYIADHLGVDIHPEVPPSIKSHLTEKAFLTQNRLSHIWKCGAVRYWPCAEFGHQSLSVATTVANTQIEYGVNGRVSMRELPEGAEIYFPSKQIIDFKIGIVEPFFATTDGLAYDNPGDPTASANYIAEALVAVVMTGWRFELITT
jgi:hypothetical protein